MKFCNETRMRRQRTLQLDNMQASPHGQSSEDHAHALRHATPIKTAKISTVLLCTGKNTQQHAGSWRRMSQSRQLLLPGGEHLGMHAYENSVAVHRSPRSCCLSPLGCMQAQLRCCPLRMVTRQGIQMFCVQSSRGRHHGITPTLTGAAHRPIHKYTVTRRHDMQRAIGHVDTHRHCCRVLRVQVMPWSQAFTRKAPSRMCL